MICRTIIVQNPFDDPSNHGSIARTVPSHPVRFNQELLTNFNINVPSPKPTSTTSLIPLPSPLPNNLGVHTHQMIQASITPAIIGNYPSHYAFDPHAANPPGMYNANPRAPRAKITMQNGTAPIHVRYANAVQSAPYQHNLMKPRMMAPNVPAAMVSQPSQMMYDPTRLYRAAGPQPHPIPPDDNILKSLLQVTTQMVRTSAWRIFEIR